MDLDSILTLAFICLPLLFALTCLFYSFQLLKAARNMEDMPTSKIRSAAQGYVELSGTLKPLLNTPTLGNLSLKPCAWYRYKIEELVTTPVQTETRHAWVIIEQGSSVDPFLLDDGTGECVVMPFGAEIMPTQSWTWRGHSRKPSPLPNSFWLWLFWGSWGRYRYTEYRLEFNLPIYASGAFYTLEPMHPFIQGNNPLLAYVNEKKPSAINLLTKQGLTENQDFIISAIPQNRLIRQFKLKSLLYLAAFIFFTTLSVHSTYPVVKNSLINWQNKIGLYFNFSLLSR